MKKLIAILLAAAMLLGLCACGGTQYDEAVLGVYNCYAAEVMGTQMKAEDAFDDACTIELKQGGKGTLHMDGKDYSMKFTLAGEVITIEADGETGGGTLKDGLMEVEILDLTLLLAKEGVEVAAAASDAGYYILSSMTEDGETFDEAMLKEFGLYGTMYLVLSEDGTGYMCFGEDDAGSFTWEQGAITADGETYSYTLEGDVLTLESGDATMVFTRSIDTPPAAPAAPAAPAEPVEPGESEEPGEPEEPGAPAISNEPVSADLTDCRVTILAAEEFTDSDGNPAVRFYYDFTNTSDELTSAWSTLYVSAHQEGYALVTAFVWTSDEPPEYSNESLKVQPGITIRCFNEYVFKPDGGTLEFTLADYEDNSITMEFDPQNLPGRPEELEMPTITDPTWTSGMSPEGVFDEDYYVKIDGYEYTTGLGDVPIVRVFFEFTNNSDEATSMFFATNLLAMQDGVELLTDWPTDSIPEDDNYTTQIEPGETILCAECYAVSGDSPVEIMLYNYWDATTIGMVIPGT